MGRDGRGDRPAALDVPVAAARPLGRPIPTASREAARVLVDAERPVIYAGQGVHYAEAWPQLRALAELLEAPVTTSLQGKSAFPEDHPLSLGSGGRAIPKAGPPLPRPRRRDLRHRLLVRRDRLRRRDAARQARHPRDARPGRPQPSTCPVELGLVGDAGLTLDALLAEVRDGSLGTARGRGARRSRREIAAVNEDWLDAVAPKLTSDETPLTPYRVHLGPARRPSTSRTRSSPTTPARPRDQLSPFWRPTAPLALHRLGQDDAARLRPRAGDGRQARPPRQALHQRHGRRRDRLHRHGLRDRRPRADPDPDHRC